MKVTVIYNPAAGGGRDALLYRFVAELERLGATVCVEIQGKSGSIPPLLFPFWKQEEGSKDMGFSVES